MSLRGVVLLVLWAWLPGNAPAHELQHQIEEGAAVSVSLFFPDDREFAFESYEIYRAGEEVPFQVGRTDARGRIVFLPDRAGTWRVKVFSEDGHGTDFSFTTGTDGGAGDVPRPFFERHLRIVVGVSLIFGVFGLVDLLMRRRGKR